ncbi:MAG: cbb3-type cytochrome c oxidase subunit II [Parachlamydiaceae bacterium]
MKGKISHFFHNIELSAFITFVGIILLFSGAVVVTLVAPSFVERTWIEPTSSYQVQMYEISDPHFYISSAGTRGNELQFVHHLKNDFSLLSFKEIGPINIVAENPELEKYITKNDDPVLKLTSRLLLLRKKTQDRQLDQAGIEIFELYDPQITEAFALAPTDGILQDWVDENFMIVDGEYKVPYHQGSGVIYVNNPLEFKVRQFSSGMYDYWQYDPNGRSIQTLEELKNPPFAFRSRKELIEQGEHLFAIEGCWYCHTDQTRTLIQDLVLNGSESYPAPPSSPNEYIYQRITFPGTKRNGPDLSRVGIKRPSRDWHKSHFWSPASQSKGSIMPSFRHFFDFDPRGTSPYVPGIPNQQFEAIFQYLMTKGTRITPPTQAWWIGKDPIQTKEIIEGLKTLP